MIKEVLLDIDGVIVGNKTGVNFPLPPKEVALKLKNLSASGIPVILCTTKSNFAVAEIIKQSELHNPHITDGGALIIDPLDNKIIKKYAIERDIVQESTANFLKEDVYFELYTPNSYYMQKSQVSDFTDKRVKILQTKPTIVDSLSSVAKEEDIIKMIAFAKDDSDMPRLEKIIGQSKNKINMVWSFHPYTSPARPLVMTALNVSKENAAKELTKSLGISFDEVLGVGDTAGDWNYMKLCKYVATVENGDSEIKRLVKTKGEGNYFIAPSVDNNGIFDILKHFSIG
jgi:hydroxymethylpyrimidine pyrophosphatase-like HAD family hydrolase